MLGAADDDGKGVALGCPVGIRSVARDGRASEMVPGVGTLIQLLGDCTLVGLGLYDRELLLLLAVGTAVCAGSDVGL